MNTQRFILIPILLLAMSVSLQGQEIPQRPVPPKLVNDLAGVLNPQEQQSLEQMLVAFNDTTTTQIVVAIVPSLNGLDIADFAISLGHSWGVGQKDQDNGMVFLVKPKSGNEGGKAFIAVGYGLEAVIPDAIARRIVENELIPYFRENDYYNGLKAGIEVAMALALKEFSAQDYEKKTDSNPLVGLIPVLIIFLVIFLLGSRGGKNKTIGKDIPFWTLLMMMGSMNSGRGSFGRFSGGSGGFGSSGGGGFGGFGGGGFGGGGAGGSW